VKHTAALLVDDDARLGALVAEYLGRHEIDVTVAADGERGLAALQRGRFDVVLLDVMLPGIDGLEVCRRIRATPALAATPVLMITGCTLLVTVCVLVANFSVDILVGLLDPRIRAAHGGGK